MKTWICVLLFALATAAQAAGTSHFQATVDGRLTIGPQGQVLEVQLENVGWLDKAVRDGFEKQIRGWRFEPIIEDGVAVNATASMGLRLAAALDDSTRKGYFSIERAWFPDPDPAMPAYPEGTMMTRKPSYPTEAARNGIGAWVMLVARVDAQGKPTQIVVEEMHLTGHHPGAHLRRLAGKFERATITAAEHWRFPGIPAGELLSVPIRFSASPPSGQRGWERLFPVDVEVPSWLAQARAAEAGVVELAENGGLRPQKLRLLTPLEPRQGG